MNIRQQRKLIIVLTSVWILSLLPIVIGHQEIIINVAVLMPVWLPIVITALGGAFIVRNWKKRFEERTIFLWGIAVAFFPIALIVIAFLVPWIISMCK